MVAHGGKDGFDVLTDFEADDNERSQKRPNKRRDFDEADGRIAIKSKERQRIINGPLNGSITLLSLK